VLNPGFTPVKQRKGEKTDQLFSKYHQIAIWYSNSSSSTHMPEITEIVQGQDLPDTTQRSLRPSDYVLSREAVYGREDSLEVRANLAVRGAYSATRLESTAKKLAHAKNTVEGTVSKSVAKITRMSEMIAAQYHQAYKSNIFIGKTLGLDKRSSKLFDTPPGFNIKDDESLERAFNYIYSANQNLLDYSAQCNKRAISAEAELKKIADQLVDVDDSADYFNEALNIGFYPADDEEESSGRSEEQAALSLEINNN
jgi:hypothetical protein